MDLVKQLTPLSKVTIDVLVNEPHKVKKQVTSLLYLYSYCTIISLIKRKIVKFIKVWEEIPFCVHDLLDILHTFRIFVASLDL